jgi:hypothetical protein
LPASSEVSLWKQFVQVEERGMITNEVPAKRLGPDTLNTIALSPAELGSAAG